MHSTWHCIFRKVLFGSMSVTSYSKPTENSNFKIFMTRFISTQDLTPDSPPCCLSPYEGNIHEIKTARWGIVAVCVCKGKRWREGGRGIWEGGGRKEKEREGDERVEEGRREWEGWGARRRGRERGRKRERHHLEVKWVLHGMIVPIISTESLLMSGQRYGLNVQCGCPSFRVS